MTDEFCSICEQNSVFNIKQLTADFNFTIKFRAVERSTIQFLSILGLLLTEGYYIKGLLFNF